LSREKRKVKSLPGTGAERAGPQGDETLAGSGPPSPPPPPFARRVLPLFGVFGIQALLLGGFFVYAASGRPPVRLRGRDAVTIPGGGTSLRADVEREDEPFPWMNDLRGRAVLFERAAEDPTSPAAPLGLAEIIEGRVELPISAPAEPGLHGYRARVRETDGFERAEADILIASVPPEKGLVLVMLPADPDDSRFFRRSGVDELDAPGALNNLSRERSIVYIARRYPRGGRAWIASLGLPPGPVLVAGDRRGGVGKLLASLGLERWKGHNAAVATSIEDAAALSLAGAHVVLLGGSEPTGIPLVRAAGRWSEAARILKEPGQG